MTMVGDWSLGPDGLPGPALLACVEAAIAAPSIHNTQPWRFEVGGEVIDVLADHGRRLEVLDPSGRELLISVGAAVLNLRVAMAAHGRAPTVTLLPDPQRPALAARIIPGRQLEPSKQVQSLARAIPLRHTNRRPFWATPTPPEILDRVLAAARIEGGDLLVVDPPVRDGVLGVVRTAENRRRGESAYRAELAEWTRATPGRTDGVPPEAFGPWDALEVVPIRDFGVSTPFGVQRAEPFEDEPTITVLYSARDTPLDWLQTGQAMQRALLTATAHDLANTLMTQPLEIPELRELLADPTRGRVAQAIIRFGYGPPSHPSPRRPVAEVLTVRAPHHEPTS